MKHAWKVVVFAGTVALARTSNPAQSEPIPAVAHGQLISGGEKPAEEPLANFTGTLRAITGKSLTLQLEDSNTLHFRCSAKTRFYDGDRTVTPSRFKTGDLVSVEARRQVWNTLRAVSVRLEQQKSPQPSFPDGK